MRAIRRITLVVITMLSVLEGPSSWAQGSGTLGSNGLEPRVLLEGCMVGAPCTVVVERLVQAVTPSLLLAVGTESAHVDLTPLGYPGAFLGIDPNPASGFFAVTDPLPVPPSGAVLFSFTPSPSLAGTTLYVQAANADVGVPGGRAFSDVAAITFGLTPDSVVASSGPDEDDQTTEVVFADGMTGGATLPVLDRMHVQSIKLTGNLAYLPLTHRVPVADRTHPERERILLPDGTSIYRFSRDGGPSGEREGFFQVGAGTPSLTLLVESSGEFRSQVAASPFESILAVQTPDPLPEFGGARVLFVRTDGENWPGTSSPVRAVALPSALGAFVPVPQSLMFLDGALLMGDGQRVVRVPTRSTAPGESVFFEPSEGVTPTAIDVECAWSADGSTACLTAGTGPLARDVYVLNATGIARNVSRDVGIYRPVDYQNLGIGGRLAVAPDGSRVAYSVRRHNYEELFVVETTYLAPPRNVTDDLLFFNYIEAEAGVSFLAWDRLIFHAGDTGTDQDVYVADVPLGTKPITITNVTATSGSLVPPFGFGATLRLRGIARTPGGGVLYDMWDGQDPEGVLAGTLSPYDAPTVLLATEENLRAQPTLGGGVLTAKSGSQNHVFWLDDAGSVTHFAWSFANPIRTLVSNPLGSTAVGVVEVPEGGETLVHLSPNSPPLIATMDPVEEISPACVVLPSGFVLAAAEDNGNAVLLRLDPGTTITVPILTSNVKWLLY